MFSRPLLAVFLILSYSIYMLLFKKFDILWKRHIFKEFLTKKVPNLYKKWDFSLISYRSHTYAAVFITKYGGKISKPIYGPWYILLGLLFIFGFLLTHVRFVVLVYFLVHNDELCFFNGPYLPTNGHQVVAIVTLWNVSVHILPTQFLAFHCSFELFEIP